MTHSLPSRSTLAFNGVVAVPHILAAEAGVSILRDGGSAMDAAIAANAVLTVVYPHQTSIGGDCFLLYHEASTNKLWALNGSGRSPIGTSREFVRAAGHTTMPQRGIHAVTVPGTIDAWSQASRKFGRLSLADVLQPAIGYASEGFPVSRRLSAGMTGVRSLLEADPNVAATYLTNGTPPKAGDRLRLPALAESLSLIGREGRDVFYTGQIGERIAQTSRRLGGAITMADMSAHRGEWVEPVMGTYKDLSIAEFPPNSQGITALIELNLAELAALGNTWGTDAHLHPLIEAKKFGFAVRDQHLTDPDFADIDIGHLTSKSYAAELWRRYDPDTAGAGQIDNDADTVAICVVDRDGNAAAMIQSTYMAFGSGVMVDGTGIMLQNRGAYFSLDDDHPNRLEGGKRTLHTLMPAMLYRDGQLAGPFVTQGGDAQAQVHLQLATNLVDFDMWDEPQAALDHPRWVAGGTAEEPEMTVWLESRFGEETVDGLTRRGHHVILDEPFAQGFGHAQLILRDPTTGVMRGASDPRADGVALGY